MSHDHPLSPSCDPDLTVPATPAEFERLFKAAPSDAPVSGVHDEDATLVTALYAEDGTQLVARSTATSQRPGPSRIAPAPAMDGGTHSASVSLSNSQVSTGSFSNSSSSSRGPSQLRMLAQEAAAMESLPVPHYVGPSSSLALPPGFGLFEYRIDKVLGQGSFGITYLATDVNLNIQVAIKEYLPSHCASRSVDYSVVARWAEAEEFYLDGLEAFLIEARTLATFQHPNIVRVVRFFEAYRTAYMVLDYEQGHSLKHWWVASRASREAWLVELLQPLLDGLALVHEAGYLHRDIKPDNIYAGLDGGRLVLLDFGAARLAAGGEQAVADVLTPGYAPAEQYNGGAQGPWTDIYAFGATLYWMITGKKPEAAPARLSGEVTMVAAVEAGAGRYGTPFLAAIDWALQPEAARRPQNVQDFANALFAGHAGTLNLQEALHNSSHSSRVYGAPASRLSFWRRTGRLIQRVLHPNGWPLMLKMTMLMMMAALMPMTITAYYNLHGSRVAMTANEQQNLESLALSTAGRISQLIGDSRHLAAYLASDVRFIDYLKDPTPDKGSALQARLMNLVDSNPDVQLAFLMTSDGSVPVSSDPEVAGMSFGFREYFQRAMAGESYTSNVVLGTTTGTAGMFFSNPVRDADGTIVGVMVLRLKATSIRAVLDEVQAGGDESIPMMIDADGVLIAYPDEKRLYSTLRALPNETLVRFVADQRFKRSSFDDLQMPELAQALIGANKVGNVSYHSTLSGLDEYAGFAPVKGTGLVVAMSESRAQFEAPLRRLVRNVLYSVLAVGLIFLVLVIGLARGVVRPVLRLITATEALKNGNFEKARIEVSPGRHIDEIGRLSRTFNVMIDVLRQREREREQTGQRRRGRSRKE
jgi:serine/threonine protein kinase/HAMP domain-containing protein